MDTPDVIVEHRLPPRCEQCGALLATDAVVEERRQVFDLVKPVLQVTEHRGYELVYGCGQRHGSGFPPQVCAPVQYGSLIKSTLVYLTQQQLLPLERATDVLADLTGVKLSPATAHTRIAQAAVAPNAPVQRIAAAIQASPVVHFDETGQRVGARLRWLHTAATDTLTWYGAHDKRGHAAMDDFGILPGFAGVAVHDGWVSYREYACTHALCNAHHLRELIYLEETSVQAWPRKMIDYLCLAKDESDAARRSQRPLSRKQLERLRQQYEAIVAEAERDNPPSTRREGQRGRLKSSNRPRSIFWPVCAPMPRTSCVSSPTRACLSTNNQAERDIRMPKLKQKTSGCFRTVAGAESFCIALLRLTGGHIGDFPFIRTTIRSSQ